MFLPFQTKLRLPSHVINISGPLFRWGRALTRRTRLGLVAGCKCIFLPHRGRLPLHCCVGNLSTLPQFLHIVPFSVSCFETRSAQMCQTRPGSLGSFVLTWHLLAAFVSFLFHASGFCKRWNFRRRGQPHKFATVTSPTIVGVTTCHAQEVEKDPEAGLAGLLGRVALPTLFSTQVQVFCYVYERAQVPAESLEPAAVPVPSAVRISAAKTLV